MADELLSDAEIEVLLGRGRSAGQNRAGSVQQSAAAQTSLPPRLSEPLTRIHQSCAREFAVELSALLRRTVRVRVLAIQETSGSDTGVRRDAASGIWYFDTKPHLGQWYIDIAPDVLMPMIDCMLGGGREPAAPPRRSLTEIELRLADRVIRAFLAALKSSWLTATTLPIEMIMSRSAAPASASATALVGVSFEIDMAAARGVMHLGIPLTTVALLLGQRSATQSAVAEGGPDFSLGESGTIELIASLGETPISQDELDQLAVGDILATEQIATGPISVSQDGVVKFAARLGAAQGHKALEIERKVASPDETSDK